MFKNNKILTIGIISFLAVICYGATSTPWDGTSWDVAAPDIDQPIGNHYKELFDLRKGMGIRIDKEHETLATASAGGVHLQGTSRMWHLATASVPNLQPNGDALDAGDNGMMWHDITTDILYVLNDFSDPTVDGGWVSLGMYLGSVDVGASKFTIDAATGNTVIAGTVELDSTLDVTGNIDPTTYEDTNGGFLNEDDMTSDSATSVASQQSIKAYQDNVVGVEADGQSSPVTTGYQICDISGVPTKVYTKYFSDVTTAGATFSVAHGIASALSKILHISGALETDATSVGVVYDSGRGTTSSSFLLSYDADDAIFSSRGTGIDGAGNRYWIKIEYIL